MFLANICYCTKSNYFILSSMRIRWSLISTTIKTKHFIPSTWGRWFRFENTWMQSFWLDFDVKESWGKIYERLMQPHAWYKNFEDWGKPLKMEKDEFWSMKIRKEQINNDIRKLEIKEEERILNKDEMNNLNTFRKELEEIYIKEEIMWRQQVKKNNLD